MQPSAAAETVAATLLSFLIMTQPLQTKGFHGESLNLVQAAPEAAGGGCPGIGFLC